MIKRILYKEKAQKVLEEGINLLTKAVSVTIGPKGRNVVLEKKNSIPYIVNDGITIANEINLENDFQNIGVKLIRQATLKTNETAGDGTTTSTILAYAIVKQGLRNILCGSNPIPIKKGIEKATKFVVSKIGEFSKSVEDISVLKHIASVSSGNNYEIGGMLAQAIETVGADGVISIEEGNSIFTEIELKKGIRFDKGLISNYFLSRDLKVNEIQQDQPYILLTDKKITSVQHDLIPLLELIKKTGKSLLIICDDLSKEVLSTLIINKLKNIINVVAVRAPGFGNRRKSLLEDLAIVTGGQVISEDNGFSLKNIQLDLLGHAKRVTITQDSTTIISDTNKEHIELRCKQIRRQMEVCDSIYEKEKLQERLAKLSGGVIVIKVGAPTEVEIRDKKLRLEDAMYALIASLEEGVVPGGGSTFIHIYKDLLLWSKENLESDELIGAIIVANSLLEPLKKIIQNAGYDSSLIIESIKKSDFKIGYNVITENLNDMYVEGILDPAKITRSALQNASSVASMILTTECIILN